MVYAHIVQLNSNLTLALVRLAETRRTLASWRRVHRRVSRRQHSRGTPITQVESCCENCQVTLRVSYSLLHECLGMGFISSKTAQLMQELSSKSHVAIMSTCT